MYTNKTNGKKLNELESIEQSIQDILTTPKGSRIMNPEYGSNLFELIDQPSDSGLFLSIYSSVVDALSRWEPRIIVQKVRAALVDLEGNSENGNTVQIDLEVLYRKQIFNFNNIKVTL